MQRIKVEFIDENDFNRKFRSLKKYCVGCYKYLCFYIFKEYKFDFTKGRHELIIPTDMYIKSIYGQVKLIYSFNNGIITLEDLEPSNLLVDGYKTLLKQYKGVPVRNEKDVFKVNVLKLLNK